MSEGSCIFGPTAGYMGSTQLKKKTSRISALFNTILISVVYLHKFGCIRTDKPKDRNLLLWLGERNGDVAIKCEGQLVYCKPRFLHRFTVTSPVYLPLPSLWLDHCRSSKKR